MTGKVAIVTGATSGVGRVAAERLVKNGLKVLLACRNLEAGAKVARALQELAPVGHAEPVAECIACDLSSLHSVRDFAKECLARLQGPPECSLQLLLLNAGMCPKTNQTEPTYSADGFEECFATNHLAHFLLAKLLLPKLKASGPSRVVVVSSSLHGAQGTGKGSVQPMLRVGSLAELRLDWRERPNGMLLYKNSKLANVLFSNELQRRLQGTRVTCNALSPGFIPNTGLSRHQGAVAGVFMRYVMPWLPFGFISTADKGADCIEYVALSPELDGREAAASEAARDPVLAARLWAISEEAVAPFL